VHAGMCGEWICAGAQLQTMAYSPACVSEWARQMCTYQGHDRCAHAWACQLDSSDAPFGATSISCSLLSLIGVR
jgi:hypothetical protein